MINVNVFYMQRIRWLTSLTCVYLRWQWLQSLTSESFFVYKLPDFVPIIVSHGVCFATDCNTKRLAYVYAMCICIYIYTCNGHCYRVAKECDWMTRDCYLIPFLVMITIANVRARQPSRIIFREFEMIHEICIRYTPSVSSYQLFR